MDFDKIITERYSVRSYADKPVEQEKVDHILQAARLAPTAVNFQPQMIYVLKSPQALAKVSRVTYKAPLVFLVCYNLNQVWWSPFEKEYNTGEQDAAIVTTHMMLDAWEQGLGSVWVRGFDANRLAKEFNLPSYIRPVCMLAVGYASKNSKPYRPWHDVYKDVADFTKEI